MVHGLVNNAGVPYRARLLDMDVANWDRVIGVNLTGTMLGMRTLAPLMPDNDGRVDREHRLDRGAAARTSRSPTRSRSGGCAG